MPPRFLDGRAEGGVGPVACGFCATVLMEAIRYKGRGPICPVAATNPEHLQRVFGKE